MATLPLVILKTFIAFFILLILTRILGAKQISQMTFFTYITGITLGNVAAEMMVNRDIPILSGLTGMVLWSLLVFVIEFINLKSLKARTVLDGEPTIVIKNGVVQRKAMARQRLNMDDLSMMLRNNKIFSIKEVDYAIFEPNGKLSVLKKVEQESVTKTDMQVPVNPRVFLPATLIVDGKVVKRNLRELNVDENWLGGQLQAAGLKRDDVMFAEIQEDGSLYMSRK
jgi:uncharacterized membrane protein YcaP (DUF421 family)